MKKLILLLFIPLVSFSSFGQSLDKIVEILDASVPEGFSRKIGNYDGVETLNYSRGRESFIQVFFFEECNRNEMNSALDRLKETSFNNFFFEGNEFNSGKFNSRLILNIMQLNDANPSPDALMATAFVCYENISFLINSGTVVSEIRRGRKFADYSDEGFAKSLMNIEEMLNKADEYTSNITSTDKIESEEALKPFFEAVEKAEAELKKNFGEKYQNFGRRYSDGTLMGKDIFNDMSEEEFREKQPLYKQNIKAYQDAQKKLQTALDSFNNGKIDKGKPKKIISKNEAIIEIKKLKELLDLGIITQKEYDLKSEELKKIILE